MLKAFLWGSSGTCYQCLVLSVTDPTHSISPPWLQLPPIRSHIFFHTILPTMPENTQPGFGHANFFMTCQVNYGVLYSRVAKKQLGKL